MQNFVWNRFLINEINAFQTKENEEKFFLITSCGFLGWGVGETALSP